MPPLRGYQGFRWVALFLGFGRPHPRLSHAARRRAQVSLRQSPRLRSLARVRAPRLRRARKRRRIGLRQPYIPETCHSRYLWLWYILLETKEIDTVPKEPHSIHFL